MLHGVMSLLASHVESSDRSVMIPITVEYVFSREFCAKCVSIFLLRANSEPLLLPLCFILLKIVNIV